MQNTILRLPEVIQRTGKSRSSIYAGIRDGSFIEPVKLGVRSIGFLEHELEDWIEAKLIERDNGRAQ